jgi:hypothetical protein
MKCNIWRGVVHLSHIKDKWFLKVNIEINNINFSLFNPEMNCEQLAYTYINMWMKWLEEAGSNDD